MSDIKGCIATDTVTVNVLSLPKVTVATNAPTNCGGTDGTITFNVTANAQPIQFSIDNGSTWQANNVFNNLSEGDYYPMVQYTGGLTCPMTLDTINLKNTSEPIINSVTANDISDCGLVDGTIVVNAVSMSGDTLEYSIDNGANWQSLNTFTGLSAGTYFIIVRNDDGSCSTTYVNNPVTITAPTAPIIANVTYTDPQFCGISDGSIFVQASAAGLMQYSVDSGTTWTTSPNFTGLIAGTYHVLVRNQNGSCPVSYNQSITLYEGPVADTDYESNYVDSVGCVGDSLTYTLVNYNGQSFASYIITPSTGWTVKQFGTDTLEVIFFSSTPNLHSFDIIVKNVNDCVYRDTVEFTPQYAVPTVDAGTNQVVCENATATLTATSGFASYTWSGAGQIFNGNNVNITPNQTAIYTLIAIDNNGCMATDFVQVEVLPEPNVSIASTDPTTCGAADGTITFTVTGTTKAVEYSINNGQTWQTGNTFTNLPAGDCYPIVRFVNSPNCPVVLDTLTLSMDAAPVIAGVSYSDISDCGLVDGTITINATSIVGKSLEFSIDNGQNWYSTSTFNGLSAGTYDILVRNDDGGCVTTPQNSTITITAPTAPTISNVTFTDPQFCNINDGSIFVQATGTGLMEYSSDSGATWTTSPNFTGLGGGTYHILIRNSDSTCAVYYPTVITLSEGPIATTDYDDELIGAVNCLGDTLTYKLVNFNGSSFSNYTITPNTGWAVQQFHPDTLVVEFYGTNGGLTDYLIEIQNVKDCVFKDTVTVDVNTIVVAAQNQSGCFDANGSYALNGSLLTLNGSSLAFGTAVTYTSNDGTFGNANTANTTFIPNTNIAGTYTIDVAITDVDGCTDNTSFIYTVHALPQANLSDTTLCQGSAVTFNVTGGSYSWQVLSGDSKSLNCTNCSTVTVVPDATTVYEVSIENAFGCATTETVTVTVNDSLALVSPITTNPITSCGICDGEIVIAIANGVAPYTVQYDSSGVTQTQIVSPNTNGDLVLTGLCPGTYDNLTVADAAGCTLNNSFSATVNDLLLEIDMTNFTITQPVCPGDIGSIVANVPLTGTYTIYDSIGNSLGSIPNMNLAAGGYYLELSIGNCTQTEGFSIDSIENWSVNVDIVQGCNNTSSLTASAINGTIASNLVAWSDGSIGYTLQNAAPGLYSVTVTDINGCEKTVSGLIVNPCPDTTVAVIPADSSITICIDTSELANVQTINGIPISVSTGNFTLDANGCVVYTSGMMSGIDTMIVVICDSVGICDTTTIIIEVEPSYNPSGIDTVYLNVPVSTSLTHCVDASQLSGPATVIANINCIPTTFAQSVTVSDTCMTYTAGANAGAADVICVVIGDDFGNFDTTVYIVTVTSTNTTPDTVPVTVPVNTTNLLCADISELSALPAFLINLNCVSTTLGNVTGVQGDSCIYYTAGANAGAFDTVCVVVGDGLGNFDTTVFVITVVDVTTDTVITDITINTSTMLCIDTTEFVGNMISVNNINCSPLDNGAILGVNSIGCMSYQANGMIGSDTICIVACDALGICDTTVMIININPTIDTIVINVAAGVLDTTCIPILNLPGTVATATICDAPDVGTLAILTDANGVATNCISYQSPAGYIGSDTTCIILCDDLGFCDTTIVIFNSDTINTGGGTVNCDTIDWLEDYTSIEALNCNSKAEFCIPSTPSELNGLNIYIDGAIYNGSLQGCNNDSLIYYSLGKLPSNVQKLDVWLFDGISYQLNSFNSYNEIVAAMNNWDSQGNWIYDISMNAIIGGQNNPMVYGDMILSNFVGNQYTISADLVVNSAGTALELMPGNYEIIIENPLTQCADTGIVNIYCNSIDTIPLIVSTNNTINFCPDDSELTGGIATMFNYCFDNADNGNLVFGQTCIDYNAGSLAGMDTVCIQVCDASNVCDTTIYIITVVPSPDTQTVQVLYPSSDTVCVPLNELPGNLTTIDFGDCLEPTNVTVDIFEPDACVYVTAVSMYDDSTCIVYCDDLGFCDTLYLVIEVGSSLAPVRAFPDTIRLCDAGTVNVLNNDDIPGGIDTVYVLDIFNQPFGGTAVVNVVDNSIQFTRVNTPEFVDSFKYVICNTVSCDTATVIVNVECDEEIIIYNGFSPNGDNINDAFTIYGVENFPDNELTIFNRWGNMVHSESGYLNTWQGVWTAKGKNLPDGTYFYVFEYRDDAGEIKKLSGYVQIHR